jgi:hypothetical protein
MQTAPRGQQLRDLSHISRTGLAWFGGLSNYQLELLFATSDHKFVLSLSTAGLLIPSQF